MNQASMSPLQELVFYRTYSRWQDSLGRRETWEEAVDRYFSYFEKKFGDKVPAKVFKKARKNALEMGAMPSMRAFWTAGEALDASHVAGYNCCYLAFKDLRSPVELFYILMCGTGVGFSVEKMYIDLMPVVEHQTGSGVGIHVVGDSKEGWSDSLDAGLRAWFNGQDIEFDYSLVRPRGSRLKTMGGRASGPEPLRELHRTVRDIILKAQGRNLKSIEWLDIGNKIAEVVVVGGVRRSSEITFSDLEDNDIRDAKDFSKGSFPISRFMSNNSAVYWEKPDAVTFLREWTALAASGAGERGIFNASNTTSQAPRRKKDNKLRCNPCVPGDTEILTDSGYRAIESLVGSKVNVWNGFEWSLVEPKVTGVNQPLVRVTLSDGRSLSCTPAHTWVLWDGTKVDASDLREGDRLLKTQMPVVCGNNDQIFHGYAQGFISAEGMDDYNKFYVYEPKEMCLPRLSKNCAVGVKDSLGRTNVVPGFAKYPKAFVPFEWSVKPKLDWLAGLLDGDGCVLKEGGAQVSSINKTFLLNVQKMLTTLGVQSKVCVGRPAQYRLLPDGNGGSAKFWCQEDWRLCVGATQMQSLLSLGLKTERLNFTGFVPNRDASRFVEVESVETLDGLHTVFCFTENKRHQGTFEGIVTGNCGEILLRDSQFCNLTEVVVRKGDTFATLTDKVKSAVWLGAMQSCLTDFPYLRPEFKINCEEERLLGVSLTGQMDNPKLLTKERLSDLKSVAIEECEKACSCLGINMSVSITTGKPSGTVSQLVDSASGAHTRFAAFYIRRVRISATDPLCRMLKKFAVPMSPENGQGPEKTIAERAKLMSLGRTADEAKILVPDWNENQVDTWVLRFPEKAPEGAMTRHDMTAIDQLEWYKKIRQSWCEHNQSITVYVRDNEWLNVGSWVYDNFEHISGVSFLPYDGGKYEQAPYEEITKSEYLKLKTEFPAIDYSELSGFEIEDNTTGAQTYACTAAGCEIN